LHSVEGEKAPLKKLKNLSLLSLWSAF